MADDQDLLVDAEVRGGVVCLRITVLGPTGCGKTVLACSLAKSMAPLEKTIINDPVDVLGPMYGKDYYQVTGRYADRAERFFRKIIEAGRKDHYAGTLLVLDEVDMLCSNRDYCCDALWEIVNQGRNFGIGVIALTRGTSDLPKNFIRNSGLVLCGQTTEPGALDYLDEFMADAKGTDFKARLRNLPPHVFLVWEPKAGAGFRGYVIVDDDGDLVPWDPKEKLAELERGEDEDPEPTSSTPSPATGSPPSSG